MTPLLPAETGWWDIAGPLVLLGLIVVWLVWLLRRQRHHLDVGACRIVAIAVAGHVTIALVVGTVITGDAQLLRYATPDAFGYQRTIDGLIAAPLDGPDPAAWSDRGVYLYLAALVQGLFGGRKLAVVVVNAGLLGTSLLGLVVLTRQLAGPRAAPVAAVLGAALPAVYLWASTPIREALVLCLTVWCVAFAVRAAEGSSATLLGAGAFVVVMNWTRDVQVPVLAAAVVVAILLLPPVRAWTSRWLARPSVLAAGSVVLAAGALVAGSQLARLAWRVTDRSAGHSFRLAVDTTTQVEGIATPRPLDPLGLLGELPVGIVRFLVGPAPWQPPDGPVLLWLDAAVWWGLAPLVVIGLWSAVRQRCRPALVVVVTVVVGSVIGALTLGNFGIISRIRIHTWVLLVPFAAWAIVAAFDRFRARQRSGSSQPSDAHVGGRS